MNSFLVIFQFLKNNSNVFTIDDVGTVSINQTDSKNEARGETQHSGDAALVVQSSSDNTTDGKVNENSQPSTAEAALELEEPSNGTTSSNDNQAKAAKQKR